MPKPDPDNKRSDAELSGRLETLQRDLSNGLLHMVRRADANTSRTLEATTFLYALIEILEQKGILSIEELDAHKDQIAPRIEKRFLDKGLGTVLQEPDQDKYANRFAVQVDCENRIHLCKAACCRMIFPLSRQDIAEGIVHWDPESPYLIAQTSDGYCRHLDRPSCQCTVREQRPIPCRVYDCSNDSRVWADFANYAINPKLEELFRKAGAAAPPDQDAVMESSR